MLPALRKIIQIIVFQLVLLAGTISIACAGEVAEMLANANKALAFGEYDKAESILDEAVKLEPKNYHVLRALAEAKIKLEKYVDAEKLYDRILSMPVAKGRDILVYVEGDAEPQEAELVDETVMAEDTSDQSAGDDQFSQFLRNAPKEPVPHYRVAFKKSGKIQLLPKSKTRIQYHGIPTATREQVMRLKTEVQKKIITSQGAGLAEEMVTVKEGCFKMGSDRGDPDEKPVHEVCISTFQIGKYEVRQKNFQKVMGFNPSQHVGADLPVESVAWNDADTYCTKMGMRLPTEAEWEYAARAGSQTEFYWGDTVAGREANFCDATCALNIREARVNDGHPHTAPVGSFPPNAFGLHDMAGNVSEWVFDWMDVGANFYQISPKKDPKGPRPGLEACMQVDCVGAFSITQKVYRGGAWNQKIGEMRSANRRDAHFQLKAEGTGFRCAR